MIRETGRARHRLALLALLCASASAFAGPTKYYVLAPEHLNGDLAVMSLEPANTITVGSAQLSLEQYDTGTIPASELAPGEVIDGTGAFVVGSTQSAADLLTPDSFAGTSFVVPHVTGQHKYFFLSPSGTANVTVRLGANTYNVQASQGVVNEFDAGSDNGIAGRVTSDQPIVLAHVAYVSGTARDAYPVPPVATELLGIRSQNAVIGASTDGTSATVYASDGTSATYLLDAGGKVTIAVGATTSQGQGSSLRIVSNYGIAAVQYDDGDGSDMTGFWASAQFGRRIGIPVGAQYVAVACTQINVSVTLYKGSTSPETQTCSSSGNSPGKVYFGASTSGNNVSAGWYLIASQTVYVMYEAATPEDEDNNLGLAPAAGPSAPTLTAVTSPTTNNPQTVSGTAGASQTVRLYVNGKLQSTTTANGSGAFSFSAELIDGNNVLYATAVTSGNESEPSNALSVVYNNTISRTQSGSISGYAVWTPGSPATPYTITATLTVAAGGKLVLQPGTTLKFASGTSLTANGELKVVGASGSSVTFTCSLVTCTRGSWTGIKVTAGTATVIDGAFIQWAVRGVDVLSGAAAVVKYSTIKDFSTAGVYLTGSTSATKLTGNLIDNLNDQQTCVYLHDASPLIVGNVLTNCATGLYAYRSSSPTVNGNNIITGNNIGVNANGAVSYTPQPVVTGNQIYGNDNAGGNFTTGSYATGAQNVKLNATGNWWGTTDPTAISDKINDLTDTYTATNLPVVDYANFLDGPNGSPVPGNYLNGPFTATSTTLTAGTTYDVLGTLFVPSGKTLTIPGGTVLRVHGDKTRLVVDGTLTLQGTSGNLATLTSGRATPARGDWQGVLIRSGAPSPLIEYAVIDYAVNALHVSVATTVRYSTIRYFQTSGVYVNGSGASGSLLQNNLIDNFNDSANCIYLYDSSPTISGNTLTNCNAGLYIYRNSSPTVNGNNLITGNDYGLYVYGQGSYTPQPVVTANQIYGNDFAGGNFYTTNFATGAQNVKLNATGNWWGTTDPTVISDKITDLTDNYTATALPTVDYSGFMDGPNGAPVPGNYLIGPFTATSTTLTSGATYEVLGTLFVPTGKTLIVQGGATMRFHGADTRLVVDGTLTVQGTSGNLATLTSGRATPAKGDWQGVLIRSGATSPLIEYAHIEWAVRGVEIAHASTIVRYSTIRNFGAAGIYVTNSSASNQIVGNLIDNLNDTQQCIWLIAASPLISGNTVTNCMRGINVTGNSSPTVNGNNIITGNDYGLYVDGGGNQTPQPVVTGNQIYGNDFAGGNFYSGSYATGAQNVKLNATGNWWGTTDATAISSKITDLTDNYTATGLPVVDYANFLDGPNGSPVPGNYFNGPLTAASTTFTSGTTYDVLGTLFVPTGKTLIVQGGATVRFHGANTRMVVDGTLTLQGTGGNLATLTSGRATPARGDWEGVLIRSGAPSPLIEYAVIDYAATAVHVSVATTIRYSTIRYFQTNGVYVNGTGASGSLLQNNLIDNFNDSAYCIYLNGSSPAITGNTLMNCFAGLNAYGNSSPAVTGNNVITGNDYGLYVNGSGTGTPQPVVTGNQIYGNNPLGKNYHTTNFATSAQSVKLNATGNWWGTTDATAISDRITDLTDNYDSTNLPTVDYSGFLDGPNGSPVPGNYLIGQLTAASTTLTTGTTYDILGTLFVPSGKTLTLQAGTVVRVHGADTRLVVDGTLTVQGTASARARLTSGRVVPAKGDWQGVVIRSTATSVVIDFAIIEWAVRAVEVQTTTATISNSLLQNFSDTGIRLSNSGSGSQITNNTIDNYSKQGYGIYLSASSPSITANRIYRTSYAIYLTGASNPAITGNILTGNNWGLYLYGSNSNSPTAVPNPSITGNDIFGNTNAQLEVNAYGATNPVVINATGNWWGTATPMSGTEIKFSGSSPTSTLNFSSPATGPLNGATGGNITLTEYYFSPNADAVKDATTIQGTLSQSANWTLTIRTVSGTAVRTLTGSGTSISTAWDGKNGSGVVQPDGIYDCEVTVPGSPNPVIVGSRLATLDNTAPSTTIASPAASSTLQNAVDVAVTGTANDLNFVDYTLEYGSGAAPSSWTSINSQTAGVSNGALGTWAVSSIDGTFGLANGPYTLRTRASDKAGNTGSVSIPVTLDNILITGVTQNLQLIRPLLSEQLEVTFTLSAPATAYLRIYPEQGGALLKEVSQVFATGGVKTLSWNGRNTSGAYVIDEAYSFTIYTTDGTHNALYDPPGLPGTGSGSGTVDSAFNAHQNDFWKMNYTLTAPKGRVRMNVSSCGVSGAHYPYNWVPFLPGTFPVMWDGRDQNGAPVSGSCTIWFEAPDHLKPASVIVKGIKPVITGTGVSPNIEVKSNPYKATHSFEQISKITYRVDQDSYVTVKLLPPGISDPGSPQAIVLVNNELKYAQSGGSPADHIVDWKGYQDTDTNDILVSDEGTYTFTIQAASVATGISTLYRGALQLWQ